MRTSIIHISAIALCVVMLSPGQAAATKITFDITDPVYDTTENYPEGLAVYQEYGDRVTALNGMANDGTNFAYEVGIEGFTPNVTVAYGPTSIFTGGPSLWRYDYGDLTRTLYQGSTATGLGNDYDFLEIDFSADPGFDVVLYGFDLGGWNQTDYVINEVAVTTFGGVSLFSDPNATVLGAGPTHTTYSFATPLRAPFLRILIDARNLGIDSEFIGIDNIRFGQDIAVDPVPEPATATLLLGGATLLGGLARRYRRAGRSQNG